MVEPPAAGARGQVALASCGAVLVVAAFALPPAFFVVVVALSFVAGVAHPLRATEIQRMAADGVRARAASFANACDMALSTITLPLAGWWRGR